MGNNTVKIGNAQGFWGDQADAPARLIAQQPDLDYLTMDYLAEVSMAVLSMQREKNPSRGYAADFLDAVKSLISYWKQGLKFKVVVNAGGLNPTACAREVADILYDAKLHQMKVGIVKGDDVLPLLKGAEDFPNMDTSESINSIRSNLISANAYLGGEQIALALDQGADIVITGRVADPSLTVGCCLFHFGWSLTQHERIAGATVAGHLIECGTQLTGGIATNWLEIPDIAHIGFPIAEIHEDGSFIVTKPKNTGGVVNEETVKEQLLYEIGDPACYISPDACVSFLDLQVNQDGENRVHVFGAKGSPPLNTYKVGATYHDGFRAEGTLTLFGKNVRQKAQQCAEIIFQRVQDAGYVLQRKSVEILGCGGVLHHIIPLKEDYECVLRLAVQDKRKEAIECFSKGLASLVTCGPQGTTGYFSGRPKVKEAFGFWPCLIEVSRIKAYVEMIEIEAP